MVEVGLDFVVGTRHAEAKRAAVDCTEAELVLARPVRMSSDLFAETNPCFRFDRTELSVGTSAQLAAVLLGRMEQQLQLE